MFYFCVKITIMRTFSSYGPVNTKTNYYAPREELIDRTYRQLVGNTSKPDGHYITIWAPRQTGKTWIMQQVMRRIRSEDVIDVAYLTLQAAHNETTIEGIWSLISSQLSAWRGKPLPAIKSWREFRHYFSPQYFDRPLVLILDEFDSLPTEQILAFVTEFRGIYSIQDLMTDSADDEKKSLLHGMALIGVHSVLGIENSSGSPFNIQRNIHVPNLTHQEVRGLFDWYSKESGQAVDADVIERLMYETAGQPGLVCWFGEQLTEVYNRNEPAITVRDFDYVYNAAVEALPNNTILNIVSKAKEPSHKPIVLNLFKTNSKVPFRYDEPRINYLYLNGVIDQELDEDGKRYVKFASPFVQKRLLNYFSADLFGTLDHLYDPFDDLDNTVDDDGLNIANLMRRYETYLAKNRHWLLKDAPRRKTDERIFEAVFHFNLYAWLLSFFDGFDGKVVPEFPTGNGKLDLFIHYADMTYGIEVKSFVNRREYKRAVGQAAHYGKKLGLPDMWLVFFIESIPDATRAELEVSHQDADTLVTVHPLFIVTGPTI